MENLSGQILKGYEIQEKIGSGGFSNVYRAYQPLLQREVAVKVILPEFANNPEFIRRFESEARLVARLEHPYIVPLFDFWREPEAAYLVMRYFRGGSLADHLSKHELNHDAMIRMIDQLANSITIAHRSGVVHRDIKPHNILLDEDLNAYLTDFGIAKIMHETTPSFTQDNIVGSPAYLSPEQIRNDEITPRTDIYSMGILMYEMIARKHPFPDSTPSDLIIKHLTLAVPDIRDLVDDLPMEMTRVIARATSKDPNNRQSDALSLAIEFSNALRPEIPHTRIQTNTIINQNPYKGLRAFDESDAADFFGRESVVNYFLKTFAQTDIPSRFLAIVGPSGSGKSSLISAGLIPALRKNNINGSSKWFITDFTPGEQPLRRMETALLSIAAKPPVNLYEQLKSDKRALFWAADHLLTGLGSDNDLLLVIDQFEELFTLVNNESERLHFLDLIHTAVTTPQSRVHIIITLRADFTNRPLSYLNFGDLFRQHVGYILPLTVEEIRQVITKPAERVGLTIDQDLISTIIDEVGDQPGTLPLLQYLLTDLFEKREGNRITLKLYHESGGINAVLAQRTEEIFNYFSADQQKVTKQLFLRLVTLGEGTDDTRRRVPRSELVSICDAQILQSVLDMFVKHRLLTLDIDASTREQTIEIAHEALLGKWQRISNWLNDNRDSIRLQRSLASYQNDWKKNKQNDDYLLQGARLTQYESLIDNTAIQLTEEELTFLNASLAERKYKSETETVRKRRELTLEKRSQRALQALVAVLLVATIGAIVLSSEALGQRTVAQNSAATAVRSATDSNSLVQTFGARDYLRQDQPDRALALALEANKIPVPLEAANQILVDAVAHDWIVNRFATGDSIVWDVKYMPDGKSLLIVTNKTLELIDAETGKIIRTFATIDKPIYNIDISKDGTKVLSTSPSDDHTLTLWDIATGRPIRVFTGHTDVINGWRFISDGKTAISGAADKTLILWDVETGQPIRTFTGHKGSVYSVDVTRDGKTAVSGAADKTLILWDIATGKLIRTLTGSTVDFNHVAISPDGSKVVSCNDGDPSNSAFVWDAATGELIYTLKAHNSPILAVAFSPDGKNIATSSGDVHIRIWDVQTGQFSRILAGHTAGVANSTFSSDGTHLVSAGTDGAVIIWDVSNPALQQRYIGHTGRVKSVVVSKDGKELLSGSNDGTLKLWDLKTGQIIQTLKVSSPSVLGVTMSPDNKYALVAADPDNLVTLWNLSSGEIIRTFEGHSAWVESVDFSPDGKYALSGSGDSLMILWDVATGKLIKQFEGHKASVTSVKFSPDGKYALSGSSDSTMLLWDIASGKTLYHLTGHNGPVTSVGFSPDGKRIISASLDATLMLWNSSDGQMIKSIHGTTGAILTAAFSPDGKSIVSGGSDGTVVLYDGNTGVVVRRFEGHEGRETHGPVLSTAFLPDSKYAVSGSQDTTIILWDLSPYPDGVLKWAQENRYVPELSCSDRNQFRVSPACEGVFNIPSPFLS